MKVVTWVIIAILFFVLGWFAQLHHESIPFLKYLQPASQSEKADTSADSNSNESEEMTPCAQVITSAINPETKEIREFPTPCDVPEGWDIIQNDIPGMELEVQ